MHIRRANVGDASGITAVLATVVAERVHSAISTVWTVEQETAYLASLSPREAIHLAIDDAGTIVGLQTLDRWSTLLDSMAHVGQVGTFLRPEYRGCGVGRELWNATLPFARSAGYRKIVVYVRGTNLRAQTFYQRLGFRECGRLTRQVIVDGVVDDEVLMEAFLSPG